MHLKSLYHIVLLLTLVFHIFFMIDLLQSTKSIFYDYAEVKTEISGSECVDKLSNPQLLKIQKHFDLGINLNRYFENVVFGEVTVALILLMVLCVKIVKGFMRMSERKSPD